MNLITSVKSLNGFFFKSALDNYEPIDRFLRRIDAVVEVKSLRKAGEPDEKPDDDNTLVAVKTQRYLGEEGFSPLFKRDEPDYRMRDELLVNHYAYETPKGMDEWVKPSEAVDCLVKLVAKHFRRD